MLKNGQKVCKWDGKPIPTSLGLSEYCSQTCQDIANRIKQAREEVRKRPPVYKKSHCHWCGRSFNSDRKTTRYCSQRCREIALKIRSDDIKSTDKFLDNLKPIKPKKSYEQYLAEDRMRPPSPHLAPPGAKPPIHIPTYRNNY